MILRLAKKFVVLFQTDKNIFEIYTDGSHKGRWGSWAFVMLQDGQVIKEVSGRQLKTGSTRMEFQAAIEALKILPPDSKVKLFSDSRILVEAVTSKTDTWMKQGWLTKNKNPIPNLDLILILQKLNLAHQIKWHWIKGHSGVKYNERCDQLCTEARLNTSAT